MDLLSMWKKKKTKTVFRVLPQDKLHDVLSFQVEPPRRSLAERDPLKFALLERDKKFFLLDQAKMRREYEEKGYVMFEVEVPDDEE